MLLALPAQAERPARATFALLVGVNQSPDADAQPLRYADDDAARYLDLFRSLGARTVLLTSLDENTARLHPQAVAEARAPRKQELGQAVAELAVDIARARSRGVQTVLYFVYAGHGNLHDGRAYLTLEDARLDGPELEAMIRVLHADHVHLIVDACYSYFLALERGPGGRRKPVHGFSGLGALPGVGLLLSTSSARESHEWEAVQAGVFSHEIRSGMYGAADADGDGQVSYREIAAFVQRANAGIPNERYRPDVYARPPEGHEPLVDLRGAERRIEIDHSIHGHYLLEDDRGVRIAELHSGPGMNVQLVRPASDATLYLRRTSDDREVSIPPGTETVRVATLDPIAPRVRERGAANDSFHRLFSLPFDTEAVAGVALPSLTADGPPPRRRSAGWALLAAGGVAAVVGVALLGSAGVIAQVPANDSQRDVASRNQQVRAFDISGGVLAGAGALALAAGVSALLWPQKRAQIAAAAGGGRISVSW